MTNAEKAYSALKALKPYDITPHFEPNMPMLAGHPNLWIVPDARTHEKNGFLVQVLIMGEHVGSHIDSALHTVPGAPAIDSYAADYFVAPYKKYDLRAFDPQPGEMIGLDKLHFCEERDGFTVEEGDIVLIDYGWDRYYYRELAGELHGWYGSNTPGLAEEADRYFVERKIRAIGADTVNCEIPQLNGKPLATLGHDVYFLPNNIPIMEGFVNMAQAPAAGLFTAFPLPIQNGSGCPVRAVLWA